MQNLFNKRGKLRYLGEMYRSYYAILNSIFFLPSRVSSHHSIHIWSIQRWDHDSRYQSLILWHCTVDRYSEFFGSVILYYRFLLYCKFRLLCLLSLPIFFFTQGDSYAISWSFDLTTNGLTNAVLHHWTLHYGIDGPNFDTIVVDLLIDIGYL